MTRLKSPPRKEKKRKEPFTPRTKNRSPTYIFSFETSPLSLHTPPLPSRCLPRISPFLTSRAISKHTCLHRCRQRRQRIEPSKWRKVLDTLAHKGTSEISTLAREGGGELMACAPWIKCPGEKARHLGSLPLSCASCVCVCVRAEATVGRRRAGSRNRGQERKRSRTY